MDGSLLTMKDGKISYDDTYDSIEDIHREMFGGQTFSSLEEALDDVKDKLNGQEFYKGVPENSFRTNGR